MGKGKVGGETEGERHSGTVTSSTKKKKQTNLLCCKHLIAFSLFPAAQKQKLERAEKVN